MSTIWHSRPVISDPVGFVEQHLPKAIEFANREIAATKRARQANLTRAVERGTCAIGHDFRGEIPINSLGTASCGYCTSALEFEQAGESVFR